MKRKVFFKTKSHPLQDYHYRPASNRTKKRFGHSTLSGASAKVRSEYIVCLSTYTPHATLCAFSGSWAPSWLQGKYALCRLVLTISAVTQLYTLFVPLHASKNSVLPKHNLLIHFIAKSRAAIAMLLLWKTWGVIHVSMKHCYR